MTTIRNLTIRNQVDGRVLPVDSVDGNVTIGELIDAYKNQAGISRNADVRMKRMATNKPILTNLTLEDAGVQDNEALLVEFAYTAGGSQQNSQINFAPILTPRSEDLAVILVPSDTIYKLEEYRSDQMKWENVMWVFIGAIIG